MASIPVDIELRGVDKLTTVMNRASGSMNRFNASTQKAQRGVSRFGVVAAASLNRVTRAGTALGASIGGILTSRLGFLGVGAVFAASTKGALDFETGLVKVGKTADIEGEELTRLGERFKQLSTRIPVSTGDLLELGAVAGQLGVKGDANILKFTETMAKLQSATNVAGEEGASNIARVLNILERGVGNVDRFGAALVDLGNNSAATEAEILAVATEVSKAVTGVNKTTGSVLGLSTAFKAMGVEAEVSRTVTLKSIDTLKALTSKGGPKLEAIAKLAGVTGQEFTRTFKQDAVEGIALFVKALENSKKAGVDMDVILNDLGLSELRVRTGLKALTANTQLLTDSVKRGNTAYNENIALTNEAAKAFETNASKLQISLNRIQKAGITLGNVLAPIFADLAESVADFVTQIDKTFREKKGIRRFLPITAMLEDIDKTKQKTAEMKKDIEEGDFRIKIAEAEEAGNLQEVSKLENELVKMQRKRAIERVFKDSDVGDAAKAQAIQFLKTPVAEAKPIRFTDKEAIRNVNKETKTIAEQKVTVDFKNVPQGAKIKQQGNASDKNFNIMMSRGFQGAVP